MHGLHALHWLAETGLHALHDAATIKMLINDRVITFEIGIEASVLYLFDDFASQWCGTRLNILL
jgi:hypothetical protein